MDESAGTKTNPSWPSTHTSSAGDQSSGSRGHWSDHGVLVEDQVFLSLPSSSTKVLVTVACLWRTLKERGDQQLWSASYNGHPSLDCGWTLGRY